MNKTGTIYFEGIIVPRLTKQRSFRIKKTNNDGDTLKSLDQQDLIHNEQKISEFFIEKSGNKPELE
jgi:hypothetical protein